MRCLVCSTHFSWPAEDCQPHLTLCLPCRACLRPARLHSPHGCSLFDYSGELRELILRCKVTGDQAVLACLVELFRSSAVSLAAARGAGRIVAAPSSLWGRLRGRIDLAWFLADALARHSGLLHDPSPAHLYWRMRKQARRPRDEREGLLFPSANDSIPTLIVDDIITTGFTLAVVAAALGEGSYRFLTLGDASASRTFLPASRREKTRAD